MLSPEQVIAAFQNAMPGRRAAFSAALAQARRQKDHNENMKFWYPAEVLRLAQDEARLRISIAAEKIRTLLDSGWQPTPSRTIHSVMSGMFSSIDMRKDAVTDLRNAVDGSVGEVAGLWPSDQPGDQKAMMLVRELGQTWLDTSNEFLSELEIHIPKRSEPMSTNINFHGDVNYVQTGGTAHVTQNIGTSAQDLVTALAALQQVVSETDGTVAADIDAIIQKVTIEASSDAPDKGTIANLLNGAAQAIQTIAAAPGAWNMVAAAATAFTGHPIYTFPSP